MSLADARPHAGAESEPPTLEGTADGGHANPHSSTGDSCTRHGFALGAGQLPNSVDAGVAQGSEITHLRSGSGKARTAPVSLRPHSPPDRTPESWVLGSN